MSRGFGATHGVGSTDKIVTAVTTHPALRTRAMWAHATGSGGGSIGYFYGKGNASAVDEGLFWNRLVDNNLLSYVNNGPGGLTRWDVSNAGDAIVANGAWFHIAVVHNANDVDNTPIIYVNGVARTVVKGTDTADGAATTNSVGYCIGNRQLNSDRNWDGFLAEFAVYNAQLSAAQIEDLASGRSPEFVAPANLIEYVPMRAADTTVISAIAGNPTVTGTAAQSEHPTMFGPTLIIPTVTGITENTATVGVTTGSTAGTLYWYVSTSATPPSRSNLIDGTGAADYGAILAPVADANTDSAAGLTAGTTYYVHWLHAGEIYDSAILTSDSFQTSTASGSPAVLSSPGFSNVGGTTATVSVDTDKNTGTLYWFVSTSASPPSAANLKSGTGAARFGNTASINTGQNNFSVTSLNYATAYYAHFIQNDDDGDSNIVSTAVFTTEPEPTPTPTPEPTPAPEGSISMPGTVTPAGMAAWMNEVNARLNALGAVPAGASVVLATDDQAVADANPDRTFIVIE